MDNPNKLDGTKIKSATLLDEFINLKVQNYVPPKRQGVSRGKKIGFSIEKYSASLSVALLNWSLKKTASTLGISYGVLRQWNLDSAFCAKVNTHRKKFVAYAIRYLRAQLKDHWQNLGSYLDGTVDIRKMPNGYDLHKLTNCACFLNTFLSISFDKMSYLIMRRALETPVCNELMRDERLLNISISRAIDDLSNDILGIQVKPKTSKLIFAIDHLKNLLLRDDFSQADRRGALIALSAIEDCLNREGILRRSEK